LCLIFNLYIISQSGEKVNDYSAEFVRRL